jgi:hypothetical protein
MMNQTLSNRFIDDLFRHLSTRDVNAFNQLITLRNEQYAQLYFKDESKRYFTERLKTQKNEIYNWGEIIEYYMLARNSLYNSDYINAYEYFTKSFKALIDFIKDAKEENWHLPIMYRMSVDLRLLAYTCDSRKQREDQQQQQQRCMGKSDAAEGGSNQDEYAERTADSLMIGFRNLCTDTRSDLSVSKRWGMMHIVNQLFKIYFKINKINLCKPLNRVIEISDLKEKFPLAHQITYKFFVGRQAMFDNDYNTASTYLEFAFQNCPNRYKKNKQIILVYLTPVNMLRGYMPKIELLLKYDLKPFAEIVNAVKQGNIRKFEDDMNNYEDFFIESGVYLFLEKLKMTTYRNLFKKLAKLLNTSQIPIKSFVDILQFLGETEMDTDECQCILSNLIFEGKIKGYISHKHNKLVISKDFKAAFPRLTSL